jgi:hypothetical protein
MSCTIVTCYYKFPSKHSYENYEKWISTFLTLIKQPIVIFCDQESNDMILKLREWNIQNTLIINKPFNQLYCNQYIDHWHKDYERDYEKHIHNPNLYIIWNEKNKFVEQAININFFKTDYFCWCDIGCFRDNLENYSEKYKLFPIIDTNTNKNKITLFNILPFEENEVQQIIQMKHNEIPFSNIITNKDVRISGTIYLGHINAWKLFIPVYYKILEKFIENDCFAGVDQNILATLVVLYPSIVNRIDGRCYRDWYYFQEYFTINETNRQIILSPITSGFGNYLMQYFTLYSLSKKYKCKPYILKDYFNNDTLFPNIIKYKDLFNDCTFIDKNECNEIIEKGYYNFNEFNNDIWNAKFHNDEEYILDNDKPIIITGFFQSYKYFIEYREELRNNFINSFKNQYNESKKMHKRICSNKIDSICVHIRRGDYVQKQEFHTLLTEDYYKYCLSQIEDSNNKKIIVFSDDINSIKEWNVWNNYDCYFVIETDEILSILLMSLCDIFIIANSTFSLNAYYLRLNSNTQLYVPLQWWDQNVKNYLNQL